MSDEQPNLKPEKKVLQFRPWIAIGIAIGAALGAAINNMAVGLAVGLMLGTGVDTALSHKKKSKNS